MFADPTAAIATCHKYYAALATRDVDKVLDVFTDDAVVVIGAGATADAVDYSGTFVGKDALREHYTERFASEDTSRRVNRPLCAVVADPPYICFPRIVICGRFKDELPDGTPTYEGSFMHVWTVQDSLIAALDAFLDPQGRLPAPGPTFPP